MRRRRWEEEINQIVWSIKHKARGNPPESTLYIYSLLLYILHLINGVMYST